MKFVCRDCRYKRNVQDRSLKVCPRCGSSNVKIYLFGSTMTTVDDEEFDWRRMGEKEYTEYWEKRIAREKQRGIKYRSAKGGESKILDKSFGCECLVGLLIPLIVLLIVFLIAIGSG